MTRDFLTQPDLHPAHRTPRIRQTPARYGDPIEHYRRSPIRWRRVALGAMLGAWLLLTLVMVTP
jgi:hypothetical protein